MSFLPESYEHTPRKKIKPPVPDRDLTKEEMKELFALDITGATDTVSLARIVTVMDVFSNDITHLAGVRCTPEEVQDRIQELKRFSIRLNNTHE